jgi:hypothetical protein
LEKKIYPSALSRDNGNHGRATNHDPDAFWVSAESRVWNIVMGRVNLDFDNIGWENLECEHVPSLMTDSEYGERNRAYPPASELLTAPC